MRSILLITTVLILVMAAPSLAQEWTDYTSKTDFFHVNFPGDPKVQDINYQTEYGITLPGHVYTVASGPGRYSVTVVDYAGAEKIHTAKADQCKKAGGEGDACGNGWRGDVQGAIVYASFQFFQRPGAKVTHYAWYNTDLVEGHRLQLTTPRDTVRNGNFRPRHRRARDERWPGKLLYMSGCECKPDREQPSIKGE